MKRIVTGFLLIILLVVMFISWLYGEVVFSVPVENKVIALSFDDGPNPGETEALLDLLDELDVRASFFLKGMNVAAHPQIALSILQRGHELGNHSWTHRPLYSLNNAAMHEEINLTNTVIKNATGITPVLFRPPFGIMGAGLKFALTKAQMQSVAGSLSGGDWKDQDPQIIAARILESAEPGDIIVLHDGEADIYDGREQGNRYGTVAATELIVQALRAQGYQIVPVGQLLGLNL